jgi:hypothetical protein
MISLRCAGCAHSICRQLHAAPRRNQYLMGELLNGGSIQRIGRISRPQPTTSRERTRDGRYERRHGEPSLLQPRARVDAGPRARLEAPRHAHPVALIGRPFGASRRRSVARRSLSPASSRRASHSHQYGMQPRHASHRRTSRAAAARSLLMRSSRVFPWNIRTKAGNIAAFWSRICGDFRSPNSRPCESSCESAIF